MASCQRCGRSDEIEENPQVSTYTLPDKGDAPRDFCAECAELTAATHRLVKAGGRGKAKAKEGDGEEAEAATAAEAASETETPAPAGKGRA